MNKIKKHSPLKNKPLRNPGQSLDEKIQDIFYDKIVYYISISILVLLVALIEWSEQIFDTPPNPLFWTFIALVVLGYSGVKVGYALNEIRNIKLGRDGERSVGQGLEHLRSLGYEIFHDVVDADRGFNIDHILVGPGGVFTIETKTISKRGGAERIEYDGHSIKINGIAPDRDPVLQAKLQARWLRDFILESTGLDIKVRPVVIFPGWFIESQPKDADVWVLNEKAFPSFLKNEKNIFDEDKINLISSQIAKYNQGYEQ